MSVMFNAVKAVKPLPLADSWAELRDVLSNHVERADKSKGSLWSPVEYYPSTTRGNRNVKVMEALVVDMDGEGLQAARLDGLEWFAYSTYSHRPDDPHYHLVLPLAEKVPAGLWRAVWRELHERLNVIGDPATKDPARIFYLPQHAPGMPFEFHEGHGSLLEIDFVLDGEQLVVGANGRSVRQPSQPRRYCDDSVVLSEDWWDEPVDLSRWDGLEGKDLYSAILKEFRQLRYGLLVTN